ncbi:zinc-finger domain-containing protein [Neisseria sp. P0015.S004]
MITQTAKNVVVIKPQDLPMHCSVPNHETWNCHTREFLPIQTNREIE